MEHCAVHTTRGARSCCRRYRDLDGRRFRSNHASAGVSADCGYVRSLPLHVDAWETRNVALVLTSAKGLLH
jgi:hypothetical protein